VSVFNKPSTSPVGKLCECGCGQEVRLPVHRFLQGHWIRTYTPTEEHKANIARSIQEICDAGLSNLTRTHNTPEQNRKIGVSNSRRIWTQKMRDRVGTWSSKAMKKLWKDPKFVYMMQQARNKSMGKTGPNKPETRLMNLIEGMFPGHYKYTGDFSFMINGKNPDFVNINGQKKCIELYGNYWHRNDDPQDRIDIFKPYGWDTLVVWERELKDLESLMAKLKQFHHKPKTSRFNGKATNATEKED